MYTCFLVSNAFLLLLSFLKFLTLKIIFLLAFDYYEYQYIFELCYSGSYKIVLV